MLTGRSHDFDTLRKKGGLSGYPSRSESEHDWVESSHASSALSYADGLAKAFELSGHRNRHVVAVVGDGALTGGMCWEALNNIAAARRPVVIVVNDNGRSYAPTIGGFAEHLAGLRMQPGYEKVLEQGRKAVRSVPLIGELCYQGMHSIKAGIKDALAPQVMFTDLGLKYLGPIDGHDEHAVETALRLARGFNAPVIVHVVTHKGMGYPPAENDEADQMHSCGVIDPETGLATAVPGPGWTSAFSDALIGYAARRRDVVAITAAMPGPTGLTKFRQRFPDRFFDVGIAEQHAMTSAAGLAMGGMHPVVAIYSTFLNRAFDQVIMDVALHKLPVTMVLDRSGVTGADGASHNGMWDLSMLGIVPGLRVAAPRDGTRLREELGEALDIDDRPTAIRFPKGDVGEDIPAIERRGGVDVLAVPADGLSDDVLLVAVGPFAAMALAVAERLRNQGIGVTVVDPRWVLPVPEAIGELATGAQARGHPRGQRRAGRCRLRGVGGAAPRRDRRALPRRRLAAGVLRPRVSRRGARRGRLDGPQRRPPDHRLGGRAGRLRRGARSQRTPRLGVVGSRVGSYRTHSGPIAWHNRPLGLDPAPGRRSRTLDVGF